MKTKKTYTPGPWTSILMYGFRIDPKLKLYGAYPQKNSAAGFIAQQMSKEDARLIAAAPDLLEAVVALQRAINNYGNEFNPSGKTKKVCNWDQFNSDCLKASAAIAKAKGR